MSHPKPSDDIKISAAFAELEKIVTAFENEELDLEDSMPKFKRGLELARLVKGKLAIMENEIQEIQAEFQAQEQGTSVTESEDKSADDDDDEVELPF